MNKLNRRNCRFWEVVERTQEEMAQTLPEPIAETVPAVGGTQADAGSGRDGNDFEDAGRDADTPDEPERW